MHTNNFKNDPFYSNGASARFAETTNDTGEVVALAARLGERLWRDGFRYSKTGVVITELLPETTRQPALWGDLDRERRERAWRAMDKLTRPSSQGMSPGSSGQSIARLVGQRGGMNCPGLDQTDKTIAFYPFM